MMLLENRTAVIYGAAGDVGSTVARAFARHGASVFLAGRNLARVSALADEIADAGGIAEAARVDALDEDAVETHLEQVIGKVGRIDVSFNAIGIPQQGVQGIPLTDLPVESFVAPVSIYMRAHFITARSAARRMVKNGSGVILMHTPEPGRLGAPLSGGMAPAWAAMEALSRDLSAEFGAKGVRSICLRTTGLPETETIKVVFGLHAAAMGVSREQFQTLVEGLTHTRRSTTLEELANAAVFAASGMSAGMTGAVLNVTGGRVTD
jgi:NAD(P)-dependent dehydrogenase (short-subunit alcohol dehydrogenase family)